MRLSGMIFKKNRSIITVLILTVCMLLSGCSALTAKETAGKPADPAPTQAVNAPSDEVELPELTLTRTPGKAPGDKKDGKKSGNEPQEKKETADAKKEITEDGVYHDLESVVLYYDKFGKLPSNFITKKEAQGLGWQGGALGPYKKGASIGGDHFGNFEKRLPDDKGVKYIECDIDTNGGKRGAKRLIISNTGKYYYTPDHYESFKEVVIRDGKVSIEP